MDLYRHLYGEQVLVHRGTAYQLGPLTAADGLAAPGRPFFAADGLPSAN